MFQILTDIDANLLIYVQDNLRNVYLNKFMTIYTSLANYGIVWILLTVGLLLYPKSRKLGICCAISIALSFLISNMILKNAVARIRPYEAYENIRCLVKPERDYSFPSGHTSVSFAAALPIYRYYKKAGLLALFAATLMAISRIYVCVHYPSDVIGGILAGLFCGLLACKIWEYCLKNKGIIKKFEKN